jgi:hypothetical protein
MFDNYRRILEKMLTSSLEEEFDDEEAFERAIEEVKKMGEQPGIHEQTKILLEETCNLIKEPDDLIGVLSAMIKIDRFIEEQERYRVDIESKEKKERPPTEEKKPIQSEPEQKKEEQPKKQPVKQYAFDREDIVDRKGTVSIYGLIADTIFERLPDIFNYEQLINEIHKIYKEKGRKLSIQSARVYATKYKEYFTDQDLIYERTPIQSKEGVTYAKQNIVSEDEPEKEIEDYILDWGRKHNNEIRPMGILTSAKLDNALNTNLREIEETIKRLEKKGEIKKQVLERENAGKQVIYIIV